MAVTWVVRTADNVFLRDKGGEALAAGEQSVSIARPPDALRERYDSGQASGIRAATAPELTAAADASLDAAAILDFDTPRLFAAIVWAIVDTYSAPATVAKFQAARTKILAAYKTRPWQA